MRISVWRRVKWNNAGLLLAAIVFGTLQTASADVCHNDDVVISGSLGVGIDTTCNMSFGFDTIILKENNLRIFFDDTSNSASFPNNDWRLVANDSSNGGSNMFAIEDATAGARSFVIEAGAASNALYVDDAERVGLSTSNPAVELHIVDGDTPTVRLEQDGSSGFTPQTWDLAGNETNFFVRDVTNGSTLPFRIQPGAPTSSIYVATDGDVGIGTANPVGGFHIENTTAVDTDDFVVLNDGTVGIGTDDPNAIFKLNVEGLARAHTSDDYGIELQPGVTSFLAAYQRSTATYLPLVFSTANVGFNSGSAPAFPLVVGNNAANGNGAHVTNGGVWTNGSSREFKENIKEVATREARDVVMNLKPVTYNYKLEPGEQYAGFIAEDVPDLVATNSRKYLSSMDIVSVVTKVVQDQQETIERQQETISALSERLDQLEVERQSPD